MNTVDLWLLSTAPELVKQALASIPVPAQRRGIKRKSVRGAAAVAGGNIVGGGLRRRLPIGSRYLKALSTSALSEGLKR